MTPRTPVYYRARIALFRDLTANGADKSKETVLLRNGVMLDKSQQDTLIRQYLSKSAFPEGPLSFEELCTFNTYFEMHPEKVAGTETVASSREFPLTIKGGKEEIEAAIGGSLAPGMAIIPPPAPWKIATFESDNAFNIEYQNGAKSIELTQNQDGTVELLAYEGEDKTESRSFSTIPSANAFALQLMGKKSPSMLELEALALETELNLMDL
jgi:hypothetical protein